jgi:hypothetical protein
LENVTVLKPSLREWFHASKKEFFSALSNFFMYSFRLSQFIKNKFYLVVLAIPVSSGQNYGRQEKNTTENRQGESTGGGSHCRYQ